jgi:hypothetical protein
VRYAWVETATNTAAVRTPYTLRKV